MNLLKIQDDLRSAPDDALANYVANPQPHVPSYLALSELQRRQKMREEYQGQQGEQPSVAEEVVQKQQMPQGGLAAMMGGAQQQMPQQPQPVQTPQPTMMAENPQQAPVMMAEGGLASLPVDDDLFPEEFAGGGMVAFEEGGEVPGYARGTYIAPTDYDPTSNYRAARQYDIDRQLQEKYFPTAKNLFGDTDLLDLVGQKEEERKAAERAGVVSPYDAAIKYYGADSNEGKVLMKRRNEWIAGQRDPYTGEYPIGSKLNPAALPKVNPPAPTPGAYSTDTVRPTKDNKKLLAPTVDVAEQKPLFSEQPTKGIADYAQELQDYLGTDPARGAQQERIAKLEGEITRQKDIAPWMALAEAGFGIAAGSSPFALQNIGAGAIRGVKAYGEANKEYQSQLEKLNSLQNDIAKADRAEKLAIGKYGAESKQAYDERVAKEKLQDKHDAVLERMNIQDNAGALQRTREQIAGQKEVAGMQIEAGRFADKTANKQMTVKDRLALNDAIEERLRPINKQLLSDLGSNASNPSSPAYKNYITQLNAARQRIAAELLSGGTMSVSNPTMVYDPKTKSFK